MTEYRNRFRALIDWDNDGFVNRGVPQGSTPNLLPYPAYGANLFPKIQPSSGVFTDAEYGESFSNVGNVYIDLTQTAAFPSTIGADIYASSEEYNTQNSTYVLRANRDYILSFYVYSSHNIDISLYRTSLQGTTETLVSTQSNVNATAGYTLVTFSISSNVANTGFLVTFARNGGSTAEIFLIGVQLVEGTTQVTFNTGEYAGYDDISQYVLTASWELGSKNFDEPLPYEGTARITLNNQSRLFSPANIDSPLYGKLQQNIMMVLEYEDGINNWITVWSGWVGKFATQVGLNRTLQAEIVGYQGIDKLRNGDLDYEITQDEFVNTTVLNILESTGFRSTYNPMLTTLNFNARLGWNTYLQSAERLFSVLSESYHKLEFAGFEWGRKTTPAKALEDILTPINARMWIGRYGDLVLKHREDFVNTEADHAISMDTGVQDANYEFGQNIINHVDVFVKPKNEVKNEVIWSTKTPITIQGHPFGDGRLNLYTRYIEMQFEFEEGTQRTITAINGASIKDMDVTVYNRDPRLYEDPSPYEVDESEWDGQVHATVLGFDNLRKKLQVRNNLEYQVWIIIDVRGNYLEGGEGDLIVLDDLNSQELINAVYSEKVDLKSASLADEGIAYANYKLHRYSTPEGEFTSMKIKDDVTIEIGQVVELTESQTGETSRRHLVIGESGDYASGMKVEMTYSLAKLDEYTYFAVDDELVNGQLNYVPDMLDVLYVSGGNYDPATILTDTGIKQGYKFNGGQSGSGVLIIGDLEGNHWIRKYTSSMQANVQGHSNPDKGGMLYGVNVYPVTSTSYAGGNPLGRDFRFRGASGTKDDYNLLINKNYLIRLGFARAVSGLIDSQFFVTATYGLTTYTWDTIGLVHLQLTMPASDNAAQSLNLRHKKDNAGVANGDVYIGNVTVLEYESLPTDVIALEEDTQYYLTMWAFAESAYDMAVKIVDENGDLILDDVFNFVAGDNKLYLPFTTTIGAANKHGLILAPITESNTQVSNANDLYMYGISITTEIPDTYEETNEIIKTLPTLFV